MNQSHKIVSVVIPYFNESVSTTPLIDRIMKSMKASNCESFEILIVENGSDESHHKAAVDLAKMNKYVRVLTLSRNFGYQGALWAGLDHARGDAIIFMDADGEDPPELIVEFIQKWQEGYDVVYGVRTSRQVSWLLNKCYQIFYRLLSRWAHVKIPLDAGEFSLISGNALRAIRTFQDRTRMLRILRAWVGYKQIGIPYHREARIAGKSKFTFLAALQFAFDGFIAATDMPVRLFIYSAFGCFGIAIAGSVYYVFWYFFGKEKIPGFASLNITLLFLFAMTFICLSVLARYIITLLDETRKRPPYLLSEDFTSDDS